MLLLWTEQRQILSLSNENNKSRICAAKIGASLPRRGWELGAPGIRDVRAGCRRGEGFR